jgi:GNAT superfamily N-acetyltransferase
METMTSAVSEDVCELADLLAILFAQEADFRPDREKQMRGLRLIIENPERGCVFVARKGNRIVGMVSLLFTVSTAEGEPVCWLEDMIVVPGQRASGLGTRLLQHAIKYAKANGFARITLLTDRTNEKAIRFYERQGFRPSGMMPLRLHL